MIFPTKTSFRIPLFWERGFDVSFCFSEEKRNRTVSAASLGAKIKISCVLYLSVRRFSHLKMREQQSLREKEIARQLSHRGSNKEIWSRGNMFSRLNKVCGGNGNAVAAICSKV